jgi:putative oxidoreductase
METMFAGAGDWGLLILRLALGIIFAFHGWLKVDPKGPVKGPAGFAVGLKQMGVPLPLFFAWVVVLLETVGAGLLILGLGTRILALGFAIDMLMAIVLVKRKMQKAGFMDPQKGGWEFEFALMSAALALLFTGPGAISLDAAFGLGP